MTPTPETLAERLAALRAGKTITVSSPTSDWLVSPKDIEGRPAISVLLAECERATALEAENADLRKRLEVAENAMMQALSDLEFVERAVPGSNLQSSILLLRYALAPEEG